VGKGGGVVEGVEGGGGAREREIIIYIYIHIHICRYGTRRRDACGTCWTRRGGTGVISISIDR